jgi:ATP-dependent helicase HrpB
MANGRGALFDPPDPLGVRDLLVISDLDGERRNARIFLAAAYDRESLMDQFSGRIQWKEAVEWDQQRQAVPAVRRLTFGALCLRTEPLPRPDPVAVTAANGFVRQSDPPVAPRASCTPSSEHQNS